MNRSPWQWLQTQVRGILATPPGRDKWLDHLDYRLMTIEGNLVSIFRVVNGTNERVNHLMTIVDEVSAAQDEQTAAIGKFSQDLSDAKTTIAQGVTDAKKELDALKVYVETIVAGTADGLTVAQARSVIDRLKAVTGSLTTADAGVADLNTAAASVEDLATEAAGIIPPAPAPVPAS